MTNEPEARSEVMKRAWMEIGEPVAHPPYGPLTDQAFADQFTTNLRFVSIEAMEQVMGLVALLPCPVCTEHLPDGVVTTYRLCIVVSKMPLGAQGQMIVAMCHHCGLKEQWSMEQPPETHQAISGQMVSGNFTNGPLIGKASRGNRYTKP